MNKSEILHRLLDQGVIAILRADDAAQLIEATRALLEGGIVAVEVTMTTPNALQVIRDAARVFGNTVLLGVGSVTDKETAQAAVDAGAKYVVTPVLRPEVIKLCNQLSIPVLSGAYSPTEIFTAHELGSDLIKVFPADTLGPNYIKSVLAPLPQLRVVPTGGVDLKNCAAFIKAGSVGVGLGSSLVSKKILDEKKWDTLTDLARQFVSTVQSARAK